MIHSQKFTAVLDTCVIFPLITRDLLLWFAYYDLFTPKWSKGIFDEWIQVMARKGVSQDHIDKRISSVQNAFPDAFVENYESLIEKLELPDPDDRHILAAAIKTNANTIVTWNLKDFPNEYLSQFGLSAKSPEDFILDTIDLNVPNAILAFKEMVLHKRNPNLDEFAVLDMLRNAGLSESANFIHSQLD